MSDDLSDSPTLTTTVAQERLALPFERTAPIVAPPPKPPATPPPPPPTAIAESVHAAIMRSGPGAPLQDAYGIGFAPWSAGVAAAQPVPEERATYVVRVSADKVDVLRDLLVELARQTSAGTGKRRVKGDATIDQLIGTVASASPLATLTVRRAPGTALSFAARAQQAGGKGNDASVYALRIDRESGLFEARLTVKRPARPSAEQPAFIELVGSGGATPSDIPVFRALVEALSAGWS